MNIKQAMFQPNVRYWSFLNTEAIAVNGLGPRAPAPTPCNLFRVWNDGWLHCPTDIMQLFTRDHCSPPAGSRQQHRFQSTSLINCIQKGNHLLELFVHVKNINQNTSWTNIMVTCMNNAMFSTCLFSCSSPATSSPWCALKADEQTSWKHCKHVR